MSSLRSWLETPFFENTLGQYAVAALTLAGLILVFSLAKRLLTAILGRWAKKTASDFDDFLVQVFGKTGNVVFLTVSLYIATLPLQLAEKLKIFVYNAMVVALTVRAALILQDIVRYFVGRGFKRARPDDPSAETFATNISNILRWALWSLALVFVLDNLGINISSLLAGLGIGGVAVAIASQAGLGDLFSALSIFVDKPFEVGDFIIIDNFMGSIEYIGLKTTRIRGLDGEVLIFSNSDLTKSRIRNYKWMKTRRVAFKFGVNYETSSEKLRQIPPMIHQIIVSLKDVKPDRVHFANFGDFSLVYEVVYFVLSGDYNLYMDRQQEMNLALKKAFEDEGIQFAHQPTALAESITGDST